MSVFWCSIKSVRQRIHKVKVIKDEHLVPFCLVRWLKSWQLVRRCHRRMITCQTYRRYPNRSVISSARYRILAMPMLSVCFPKSKLPSTKPMDIWHKYVSWQTNNVIGCLKNTNDFCSGIPTTVAKMMRIVWTSQNENFCTSIIRINRMTRTTLSRTC